MPAAVLGVNPLGHLLAARGVLSALPVAVQQIITGREFFPDLISGTLPARLDRGVRPGHRPDRARRVLASALRGGRPVPLPDSAQQPEPGQQRQTAAKPV